MVEAGARWKRAGKPMFTKVNDLGGVTLCWEEYASSHKKFHVSTTKVTNHGHPALLFEA